MVQQLSREAKGEKGRDCEPLSSFAFKRFQCHMKQFDGLSPVTSTATPAGLIRIITGILFYLRVKTVYSSGAAFYLGGTLKAEYPFQLIR